MKKALIVATIGGFLPVSEINNAQLLQSLGYEVHYAANFKNRIYDFDEEKLTQMGFVLHQVEFSKNPYHFRILIECIKTLKSIIQEERIQLVHCHNPVAGVAARIAAHICRKKDNSIKVVYTAHGFHFYSGAPLRNWILYYPVEFLLSKWTDCLVTINVEDGKRAQKMLCKRSVSIPGVGIKLKRFKPQIKEQRDEFRVISVGELNENKNHSTVIRAIAQLNDEKITYDIYGNGALKEELKELSSSLKIENQVRLKGFCKEIEEPLAEADVLVFPSYREGLGLAALEAMACGVPVIAADNRGTREYMVHEKNGIVCNPSNVEEFASAIKRIKEHPIFALRLTEEALQTVQKFSTEETNKIMRKVYEEL